jgi:hypothetical protein
MRYTQCGPGLPLAMSSGPDDDDRGCLGIGFSTGTGANPADLLIRMADNGSRWPWPLSAYSHVICVWPHWFDPDLQVMESFPPDGVQARSLQSIIGNRRVSRLHIHWLCVSLDGMARARNLGESMRGHPYSWGWCVKWFLHHRHPRLFKHPGGDGIVCSTFTRLVLGAALGQAPVAYTPCEQYEWLYGHPSWRDGGVPRECPHLIEE